MDATFKENRLPNPRTKANFFEIISYSWLLKLLKKGLKKDLDLNDLYTTLDDDSSALLGNKLQRAWDNELLNNFFKKKKPSFLKALCHAFGARLLFLGLYMTTTDIFVNVYISIAVGRIVQNYETNVSDDNNNSVGIILAATLILSLLMKTLCFNYFDMNVSHLGMRIRVAVCDIIYNKALRLKSSSLDQTSTGQIVNLMSNDVNRFDASLIYIPYLWKGPLETIILLYFMWQEVGVSAVLGVATIIVFIPVQVWLASKISKIRLETAKRTDERINLMSEIISGLQTIKMYSWEPFFDSLTKYGRKKEINKIVQSSYIKGVLTSFFFFSTRSALFVNLFAYVLLGNYITASTVFMITTYYNTIKISMALTFPTGIGLTAELLVTIKRIQDFLLREEKDSRSLDPAKTTEYKTSNYVSTVEPNDNGNQNTTAEPNDNGNQKTTDGPNDNGNQKANAEPIGNNFGIVMSDAIAKWKDTQTDNCLENINLTFTSGKLIAIIGPVGAGKSSLIQAILRELQLSGGSVTVTGTVSYASQEPWLFAGSVQKNILFGSPMDTKRYKQIIEVCSLKTDLDKFPYGDRTVVGERGVALSGGQRARINLARAIYKQADIYLLDDPLSAVDTVVGKHLFENCIKDYLKDKTCILVTHQIQYLTDVDQIVLMENARVLTACSYQELQDSGLDITKLLRSSSSESSVIPDSDGDIVKTSADRCLANRSVNINRPDTDLSSKSSGEMEKITDKASKTTAPAETDETKSVGNVSFYVYSSYFFSGGHCCKVLSFFLVCILTQVITSGSDYWTTFWVNLEENDYRADPAAAVTGNFTNTDSSSDGLIPRVVVSRYTCVAVYAILTLLIIIAAFAESVLLVSVCTTASMNLHSRMFNSIARATMGFLNKNPSGRILNRFSKDIGLVDEVLPSMLVLVIQNGLTACGIIIIVGIVNFCLIPPTISLLFVFYKMKNIYMVSTRNIKRLEGIARSPMYTHVNSSLQGLTTIRAFEMERTLSREFAMHQDLHSSAWYLFITLSRAFGNWLDFITLLYVTVIVLFFTFISHETHGGDFGLVISQVIVLAGAVQWLIRYSADLENQMTSVERILEYTKLPQESALESTLEKKPPKEWPITGRIVFESFYLRYDLDSPFVLRNLNINIEHMEKIGIVGRTGAGKSSLIGALFRLAVNEGKIIVDDREIHDLGLRDLRSKISIIPQEPVLFAGTMRANLDPFDEYPDHVVWKALEEVELKEVVEDLPDGLHSKVSKGGSNFSVGQRQLVCLARALVRGNKILVLDEATANVDLRTDNLIQKTIRNNFSTCTVLTIAHRLNTVMDSDRILVLDNGAVVEFAHPYELLKNKDGFLYKMVEQTGETNAGVLRGVAEESYNTIRAKNESQSKRINEDEN